MEKKITRKFERVICTWCGTDRRWRKTCARGPACWKQAKAMGTEPGWFDASPNRRKKRGKNQGP